MTIMDMPTDDAVKKIRSGEMNLCVVGLGRMGLPIACLFADAGARVTGVDTNLQHVKLIANGISPFSEPGLQAFLKRVTSSGKLTVSTNLKEEVPKCEVIVIVVPTLLDIRKNPDYSILERVCREVGLTVRKGSLIILESTVGPGFTETAALEVVEKLSGLKAGVDFGLAYSPIRATAGQVIRDIVNYPRVVAGIDGSSLEKACAVLSTVIKGNLIRVKSIKAAEAVKIFENVYRDVNIALANVLARFCEEAGLDYGSISEAANTQPYCHLHRPGIVGGKCIPVNPYFLTHETGNLDVDTTLVQLARKVNDGEATHVARMVAQILRDHGKPLKGANVLVLGASYRANVKGDDLSPCRSITEILKKKGAKVTVWDPLYTSKELKDLGFAPASLDTALEKVDCLVVSVGHDAFRQLKTKILEALSLRKRVAVVDCSGYNIFTPLDSTDRVTCAGLGFGKL